jgi:hypothetical protein
VRFRMSMRVHPPKNSARGRRAPSRLGRQQSSKVSVKTFGGAAIVDLPHEGGQPPVSAVLPATQAGRSTSGEYRQRSCRRWNWRARSKSFRKLSRPPTRAAQRGRHGSARRPRRRRARTPRRAGTCSPGARRPRSRLSARRSPAGRPGRWPEGPAGPVDQRSTPRPSPPTASWSTPSRRAPALRTSPRASRSRLPAQQPRAPRSQCAWPPPARTAPPAASSTTTARSPGDHAGGDSNDGLNQGRWSSSNVAVTRNG